MLVKPDYSSSSSTAPTTCGNCGVEERRLLHHVRHRGIFRRLCTTCVLRLHAQSFCPTCFAVYPSPPPSGPNDAVACFKCYSSSHSHCVGNNIPNPYICPICVNPNSPIFTLKKVKDLGIESSEAANAKEVNNGEYRVIDKKAAKVLLAAAKIAASSMNKAAVAARVEAERMAIEAAFTRKRSREALEHVVYLVAKEKLKKKEAAAVMATENLVATGGGGSGNGFVANNNSSNNFGNANLGVGMVREERRVGNVESVDRSNDVLAALNAVELRVATGGGGSGNGFVANHNSSNNFGNANMGVGMVREERRVGNVESVDGSNDVLAALNAVELREGEKMGGFIGENAPLNDVVPMDVEENRGVEIMSTGLNDGIIGLDYHGGGSENQRSGNGNHVENHGGVGEKLSNGDVLVLPVEDQVPPIENSHLVQQNDNG